jgi:epoxyqueuosine reductase
MEKLLNRIEKFGWRGKIVTVNHLSELRDSILNLYSKGLIDKKLYEEQLDSLSFDLPTNLPNINSIIIVAVPTPQMRITITWHGKSKFVIIPPTYVSYTQRTENTRETLAKCIGNEGYHLVKAQLPLKTLAVCSGLAKYGRNNICYVNEMGSFFQLAGAFSDLPCKKDSWCEPSMLERCKTCLACLRNCPTKAITKERFLLHAEKCLTFHNESSGDFPGWIDPSWHHCLFGCMRCQYVCPENKTKLDWFEDRAEFSEQETFLLLKGQPLDRLPKETASKIKSLQLSERFDLLCRNLSMIVQTNPTFYD